jgi:hypothetical protein
MASLRREAADGDSGLRRLYRRVEEGISELDDALKERIAALKVAQQAGRAHLRGSKVMWAGDHSAGSFNHCGVRLADARADHVRENPVP